MYLSRLYRALLDKKTLKINLLTRILYKRYVINNVYLATHINVRYNS